MKKIIIILLSTFIISCDDNNENIEDETIIEDPSIIDMSYCRYETIESELTAYLTFDDGPTKYTEPLLDLLDEYNIKATFFVVGTNIEKYPNLVKRMHKDGHLILNHTFTHRYDLIYSNIKSFNDELLNTQELINNTIGCIQKNIFRIPGGSSNTVYKEYNENIMSEIFDSLKSNNFKYLDWNIDVNSIYEIDYEYLDDHVINSLINKKVILDHDTHSNIIAVTNYIIKNLKEKGYSFSIPIDKLDYSTINHK